MKKIFTRGSTIARDGALREIKMSVFIILRRRFVFSTVSGTIFLSKSFNRVFHQNVAAIQKMTICAFHQGTVAQVNVTGVLKTLQEG
ncbi:hypothetical protein KCP78_04135 [Salmonella enterica subsp. enterica]|nr:hypothetical protein KCP78_04135 [Salmonella enterica subsp. enterica]